MPLELIFNEKEDKKYKDCKWKVFGYIGGNKKCKVWDYLETKVKPQLRANIIEKLEELALKGPNELAPPCFDEAGAVLNDFIMYRIRKSQERLYMALQWSKKRAILTSGCKKKTVKTAQEDKNNFYKIVNKVISEENGE